MAKKSVYSEDKGDLALRVVQDDDCFTGALLVGRERKALFEGDNLDEVLRLLRNEVGKVHPNYFGFDGARGRFLHFFPNGFETEAYSEGFDRRSSDYVGFEREYKLKAKAKLDSLLPLGEVLSRTGLGEAALSVFRATNLLSPFEKTRLQDVLRGPTADAFVHGAARFAMGDLHDGLLEM